MNSVLVRPFPPHRPVFRVLRLPFLARLYRYIYHQAPSSRWGIHGRKILRKIFPAFRRLCGRSEGEFEYVRNAKAEKIIFNARNVQFLGVYVTVDGYELEVEALMDSLLPEGGTLYDIGSNWGYFTLYPAACRNRLAIHAFEPMPETYSDLASCVRQAGLSEMVTCHQLALSEKEGEAFIHIQDGVHSGTAEVVQQGKTRIVTRRLDSMGLPPPDFVKLDAENHEVEVLTGALETIKAAKPFIVFENKPDYLNPEKAMEVLYFLERLGYVFFVPAVKRPSATRDYFMQVFWHPIAPEDGLVLYPFQPESRLLFQHELNVFACHRDRMAELHQKFKSLPCGFRA
jgi:FkbM family methyltransferase